MTPIFRYENLNYFRLTSIFLAIFFIFNAIILYLLNLQFFVIRDVLFVSLIFFLFSFLKVDSDNFCGQFWNKKSLILSRLFLFLVAFIFLLVILMGLLFFSSSINLDRVSWLHFYSKGIFLVIPMFAPLLFAISIYFKIHRPLSFSIIFLLIILDGTRMNIIYYLVLFLVFNGLGGGKF